MARKSFSCLSDALKWSEVQDDARYFVRDCIHCTSTVGGKNILRPLEPELYVIVPKYFLQFYYVELSPSKNDEKYILMLCDDYSGYCSFLKFGDTSAENAVIYLIKWSTDFGVSEKVMSDCPTHF